MSQPTDTVTAALVPALYRVLRAMRQMSAGDPVEGPTLGVLHQMRSIGAPRLSELAADVGLDISTVSRQVRALEHTGWVARTADPDDRRAARLELTPAGSAALDAAVDRRRTAMRAATVAWTDKDRQTLATLLTRLADDLACATCPEDR